MPDDEDDADGQCQGCVVLAVVGDIQDDAIKPGVYRVGQPPNESYVCAEHYASIHPLEPIPPDPDDRTH